VLSKSQRKALESFSEPGHYTVGWRREQYRLSWEGYIALRQRGLIEEVWTWASTTRPDVGITATGKALLASALERHAPPHEPQEPKT
jgi:hypothetical protein